MLPIRPTLAGLALLAACASAPGSIGVLLTQSQSTRRVTIREVPAERTGAKAGLRAGDEVLSVDGRDVRELDANALHEALKGPIGSRVRLTVLRDGAVLRLNVERGPLAPRP